MSIHDWIFIACAGRKEDSDEQHKWGVNVGGDVAHFRSPSQIVIRFDGGVRDGVASIVVLWWNVVE